MQKKNKICVVIESYWQDSKTIVICVSSEHESKYRIEIKGRFDICFADEIIWQNDQKLFWYSFDSNKTKELNIIKKPILLKV